MFLIDDKKHLLKIKETTQDKQRKNQKTKKKKTNVF